MRIILALLFAGCASGQTLIDYQTQLRNTPGYPDGKNTSLATSCSGARTANIPLTVTQNWTGLGTQTLNCDMIFVGGSLRPNSGQVLTITGVISAAPVRIFDYSAGGTVALIPTPPISYPQWYGQPGGTFLITAAGNASFLTTALALGGSAVTGTGGGVGPGNALLSATTTGLYLSLNGAPPTLLAGSNGAGAAGGPTNSVQYNTGNGLGGSLKMLWDDPDAIMTICAATATGCTPGSGIDAPVFSSSNTLPGVAAFTNGPKTFHIDGDGSAFFQNARVTTAFNSLADVISAANPDPSKTQAFTTSGGNFEVFGDGQVQAQTFKATSTFNSRADDPRVNPVPATTAAFQTSGGNFEVFGDGQVQAQTFKATTVFNSVADNATLCRCVPATTAAFQTSGGDVTIYGDGNAGFQAVGIGLAVAPRTGLGGGTNQGNAMLSATTTGLYLSLNGAAPTLVGGGSGTAGPPTGSIQYNTGTGFGGSGNLVWNNSTFQMTLCPAPATGCTNQSGIVAPAFASSATLTNPSFVVGNGIARINGDGKAFFQYVCSNGDPVNETCQWGLDAAGALTVSSCSGCGGTGTGGAQGPTNALQYNTGTGFGGSGNLIWTNGLAQLAICNVTTATNCSANSGFQAPTFSSSATGTAPAFVAGNGAGKIFGNGDATFQDVTVTATFNSVATGTIAALTQATQQFQINGDGKTFFQSICTLGNPNTEACTYGLNAAGVLTVASCTGCGTGSGTPGTPTNSIQFSTGTAFAGSANMVWNNTTFQMTICTPPATGCTNQSGVNAPTFSSSATGINPAFETVNSQINGDGKAFFQSICTLGNLTTEACTYGLTATGVLTVASCTGCTTGSSGVSSWNTRTGAVTFTKADVTAVTQPLGTTDSPTFATITVGSCLGCGTGGSPTAPGAPPNSVQFNNGGVFGGNANFTWANGSAQLTICPTPLTGACTAASSGIIAPVHNSTNTGTSPAFTQATQQFQINGDGKAFFQSICTSGNANTEACTYGLTATGALTVSGCTGCGGVTSLASSGNGITFNSSTGAITASLAQDIRTTASPTFGSLTLTGTCTGCGGSPSSGAANYVQYSNGAGGFVGSPNFTFNPGTNIVTLPVSSGGINAFQISSSATGGTTAFNVGNFIVRGSGDVQTANLTILGTCTGCGTGVTSLTSSGNGLTFNASTGAITASLAQDIRTTGSPTFTNVTASNNMQALNMTVTSGGLNVGTATGSGGSNIAVSGLGAQISKAGVAASAAFYDSGGNCTIGTGLAGGFGCSSDLRMKQNVVPLASALSKILQLRPVTFQWKANKGNSVGFISQEVQTIFPLLIYSDPNDKDKYLSLSEIGMMPYLVKAIQELNARIAVLEGKR